MSIFIYTLPIDEIYSRYFCLTPFVCEYNTSNPAHLPLQFGAGCFILYVTEMESDLSQLKLEHGLTQLTQWENIPDLLSRSLFNSDLSSASMRTNPQSLLSSVIPQTIKDCCRVDVTRFKLETGRV